MSENGHNIVLDKSDPFEACLVDMVVTARKKRADYAQDGNPFSNFEETSSATGIPGFTREDAAMFNCTQKQARLRALKANGRMNDPKNESVYDTKLDFAVYAVLMLAMAKQDLLAVENGIVKGADAVEGTPGAALKIGGLGGELT
jgi:hypothetical protein